MYERCGCHQQRIACDWCQKGWNMNTVFSLLESWCSWNADDLIETHDAMSILKMVNSLVINVYNIIINNQIKSNYEFLFAQFQVG